MGSILKDNPVVNFDPPQIPTNIVIENNNPPVKGIYCYSANGVNYSYSILNTDSPQYSLWKPSEDL